jgi:hypothetical protein
MFLASPPLLTPPPEPPMQITDFELRALAFADLLERIIENSAQPDSASAPDSPTNIPLFSTIRCICGHNENHGELVQCHDCHCYLHLSCIDRPLRRGGNLRCPFCALQLDGIDLFHELRGMVDSFLTKMRTLHTLVSEAASIESQMVNLSTRPQSIPDSPLGGGSGMNHPRPGMAQLRTSLAKTIQDINQQVSSLINQ